MFFAALQEVQSDDVESYITGGGSIWKRKKVDFLEWQENQKASFFFCKLPSEKLIQVESPYKQTPLNYANPHAQVIISSPPSPLPSPHSEGKRESLFGSYFDILKILFLFFFFWVLMRNGRNGLSFCTF